MQHLTEFNYVRRNPDEAYKLAKKLEPTTEFILENQQVVSPVYPDINYSKDSLQEIHKRLSLRKQIALH